MSWEPKPDFYHGLDFEKLFERIWNRMKEYSCIEVLGKSAYITQKHQLQNVIYQRCQHNYQKKKGELLQKMVIRMLIL